MGGTTSAQYAYDGHGRRVWDYTTADSYSHYSLDGRLLMNADHRAWKVRDYVQLNGSLLAIRERDVPTGVYTVKYQHTDALGTPVVMTDGNRVEIDRREYEPYGEVINQAVEDGPGFTGHVEDAATGLTYMQQRYYDPTVGRFLSMDPVVVRPIGDNFNRYWYANNNPFKFVDPDGRNSAVAGAAVGCAVIPACRNFVVRSAIFVGGAISGYLGSEGINGWNQRNETSDVDNGGGSDHEQPTTGAVDLVDDLAAQESKGKMEAGEGKVLPGMGDRKFDPETGTHDKVAISRANADGTRTEVHGDRSRQTGQVDNLKVKQQGQNSRKEAGFGE